MRREKIKHIICEIQNKGIRSQKQLLLIEDFLEWSRRKLLADVSNNINIEMQSTLIETQALINDCAITINSLHTNRTDQLHDKKLLYQLNKLARIMGMIVPQADDDACCSFLPDVSSDDTPPTAPDQTKK